MPTVLQQGETIAASVLVRATPDEVYAVVSDVTRTPEWSPETHRSEWIDEARFRSWNRRRLGRWSTEARVVTAEPGREFAFVVELMGGDWTRWTYSMEAAEEPGTTRLTEEFLMCVPLPKAVQVFERVFLMVRDRRGDLKQNLEHSLSRIRDVVESGDTTDETRT